MYCVFCRIIRGEIPAVKIYENEKAVVFLDIHPVNPGHMLVLSKEHYENMVDCPDEVLKEMIVVAKKVSLAVMKALDLQGFNLIQNNGSVAGQVIPHIHWHIIPRLPDDGLKHWPGGAYKDGEAGSVSQKIKQSFK